MTAKPSANPKPCNITQGLAKFCQSHDRTGQLVDFEHRKKSTGKRKRVFPSLVEKCSEHPVTIYSTLKQIVNLAFFARPLSLVHPSALLLSDNVIIRG
jgi:hypothetical protein